MLRNIGLRITVGLWVCFFIFAFLTVRLVRVESDSMAQTLISGDHLLVCKVRPWESSSLALMSPKRFDIIVYRVPGEGMLRVKRVIGVPRDSVRIHDGKVVLNGANLAEEYVFHMEGHNLHGEYWPSRIIAASKLGYVVPEDHYFVLGDNRAQSEDSRRMGPVSSRDVLGVALLILRRRH